MENPLPRSHVELLPIVNGIKSKLSYKTAASPQGYGLFSLHRLPSSRDFGSERKKTAFATADRGSPNLSATQVRDMALQKQQLDKEMMLALVAYKRRARVRKSTKEIQKTRSLAKKFKSSLPARPASQQGMRNLTGVLCYRHSLLQALLHIPKLVNWLLTQHGPENCVYESQETCVCCALRQLTHVYWDEVNSKRVNAALMQIHKIFKYLGWADSIAGGQNDSGEQFGWILDRIQEQIPKKSYESLTSIFNVVTTTAIHCQDCGNESKTTPLFERALAIGLAPKLNNGSISRYMEREFVDNVEGYRCESCKKSGKRRRVRNIEHGPDVLIVQLNRYSVDYRKDTTPIETDSRLDLNRFRGALCTDNLQYEPVAVVDHIGTTGSGHYTCSARGPDGVWHCFNDSTTSKVRPESVSGSRSRTSYLVFFQRKAK